MDARLEVIYMESDRDVSGSHVMTCYIQGPQIQK